MSQILSLSETRKQAEQDLARELLSLIENKAKLEHYLEFASRCHQVFQASAYTMPESHPIMMLVGHKIKQIIFKTPAFTLDRVTAMVERIFAEGASYVTSRF